MGRVLVQLPGTTTAKALTETLSKNVLIVDEDLNQLRLHDGVTAGGHLIGNSAGSGVPVGTIIPFAGNSVPQGYLLCDGSAISRTTYASLFAVIGTIYGAGDGSTTFNLPDYREKTFWFNKGHSSGYTYNGYAPNITGGYGIVCSGTESSPATRWYAYGAMYQETTATRNVGSSGSNASGHGLAFNASRSSYIYGNSHDSLLPDDAIVPRSLSCRGLIKY